jgi:hypothetical protein
MQDLLSISQNKYMKTYFRSIPVYHQSPSLIDRENGIIKDVVLCQVGEAKGHELFIDQAFINNVVTFGNENQAGIKARFGHPNICSTALGSYLGRFRNFRMDDDKAIADLHLDKSSQKSPKGNLYDYIFDLAESNPDMFGASIAFKMGKVDTKLEKVDGQEIERKYASIISLFAADLVDDPAATDGLFESFHEDEFAFLVSVFLDEHPEIYSIIDRKPEVLNEFLSNYKNYKNIKSMNLKTEIENLKKWVSENFSTKKSAPDLTQLQSDFNTKIQEIEDKLTSLPGNSASVQLLSELDARVKTFISTNQIEIDQPLSGALFDKIDSLIQFKDDEINRLTTELNKEKAFPSVPDKKGDPKLNIHKKENEDNSGKVLLENLPDSAKRKLKKT